VKRSNAQIRRLLENRRKFPNFGEMLRLGREMREKPAPSVEKGVAAAFEIRRCAVYDQVNILDFVDAVLDIENKSDEEVERLLLLESI
jgi:hypothetical protein